MEILVLIVHVLAALSVIGLVLLQHGKGADMGAAFGAGASGTLFGSRGSANFLSHATAGLAAVFFVVSLSLAYLVNQGGGKQESVLDAMPAPTPQLSVPIPTEPPADIPAPAAPTEAPE